MRCRHTVGLNWTAIGIEHVGTCDAVDPGRPASATRVARAHALADGRLRHPLRDVIGHNESLTSPYHRERVAPWRCQTHGDWTQADMNRYRALLAALARRDGVPVGRRVDRAASRC